MKTKRQTNGNSDDESSSASQGEDQERRALIALRAYEKWHARGCPEGDDARDWLEAEQELSEASDTPPEAKAKSPPSTPVASP